MCTQPSSLPHITARRYVLWPPCCQSPTVALGRQTIDLQLTHRVSCTCGASCKVTSVGDGRHGLRVTGRADGQRA